MRLNKSQSKLGFSKNRIIKGARGIQIIQNSKRRGMLGCEFESEKGS